MLWKPPHSHYQHPLPTPTQNSTSPSPNLPPNLPPNSQPNSQPPTSQTPTAFHAHRTYMRWSCTMVHRVQTTLCQQSCCAPARRDAEVPHNPTPTHAARQQAATPGHISLDSSHGRPDSTPWLESLRVTGTSESDVVADVGCVRRDKTQCEYDRVWRVQNARESEFDSSSIPHINVSRRASN